ncbi:MAG: type II toxin-antitoxin system VapC family toxin [Anaerolineae bacterium]
MADFIIIDTDILIDAGRGVAEALACLSEIEDRAIPSISSITEMELVIGCRNKTELHALDHFLARFDVIGLNERISQQAVELLRQYRLSHGLLIADALIAATALVRNTPFVTKNNRDYRFIAGLNLLPYPNPFVSENK